MPATRTENSYDIVPQVGTVGTGFSRSPRATGAMPQIIMSGISSLPEQTAIPDYKGMKLRRSLILQLQYSSEGVTIESDWVDEAAWGRTLEAAQYDFLTSLGDRYISLSARVDSLSRRDQEVFGRLRVLLFQ